ncbi:MAG: hypothetical protein V1863_03910 [Candidatus Omnitrophota bacterium]
MRASILDAQHTLFEGLVSAVTLPAADGQMTILDNHEPVFVALGKGVIRLESVGQRARRHAQAEEIKPIMIRQGIARMKNNELIVLVE